MQLEDQPSAVFNTGKTPQKSLSYFGPSSKEILDQIHGKIAFGVVEMACIDTE